MISIGVVFYKEPLKDIDFFLKALKLAIETACLNKIKIKQIVFVLNTSDQLLKNFLVEFQNSMIVSASLIEQVLIQNNMNNIGLARRLIIENSTSEWVYFTDPDVILQNDTFVHLGHESLLITKALTLGITGSVVHKAQSKYLQELFNLSRLLNGFSSLAFQGASLKAGLFVDHAPTAHLLVNKSIVQKLGSFSQEFDNCGEDLDLTHRATQQGYSIYFGKSQVMHQQNFTAMTAIKKFFGYGQAQASVFMKNGFCCRRIYRLIPALFSLIFFILCLLVEKKLILFLGFFLVALLFFAPQLVFVLFTVFTYGMGTVCRLISDVFTLIFRKSYF